MDLNATLRREPRRAQGYTQWDIVPREVPAMKRLQLLGFAALCAQLALASGCAGKPTLQFASDPNARFDSLNTFAWFDDPSFVIPRGGSIVDGQFIDRHIREAVDRDLTKKGFSKAANEKA